MPAIHHVTAPMDEAERNERVYAGEILVFRDFDSVANTTDRTRLSFETRTVNASDVTLGRGAPNVDGRAPRATLQMFRHLTGGEKLGSLN